MQHPSPTTIIRHPTYYSSLHNNLIYSYLREIVTNDDYELKIKLDFATLRFQRENFRFAQGNS